MPFPAAAATWPYDVQRVAMDDQVSDETIRTRVEAQLRLDPRLEWELLHVNVHQGHVTLFGKVASQQESGWAETVASTVPGVVGLTNNIIVDSAIAPDHKIRNEIWTAFKTIPALENNSTLRIYVNNGQVTLQGEVQGKLAQRAAEKAAEAVPGVSRVVNLLKIVPKLSGKPPTEQEKELILPGSGERKVLP
jgi:osmotically-inducible protein OsmY